MADPSATQAKCANCANCAKTNSDSGVELKICAKCHTTRYCSKECQKNGWKAHQKLCARIAISSASHSSFIPAGAGDRQPHVSPASRDHDKDKPDANNDDDAWIDEDEWTDEHNDEHKEQIKGLAVAIEKPFHHLHDEKWLHDRPEKDVFKLLIDTYRLRVEDEYVFTGDVHFDSLSGGSADGRRDFRRFLGLAEKRAGLLPSWWSWKKAAECTAFGWSGRWSSLAAAVEKHDIIEHYGDPLMPMQLRMFGEQVYKNTPFMQSGFPMMQLQMQAEEEGIETFCMNTAKLSL